MPTRSTPRANWKRRRRLFADAERRQEKFEPTNPYCMPCKGIAIATCCSRGDGCCCAHRAIRNIEIAQRNKWVLAIALDALTLGRAHLALALEAGVIGESANAEALAGGSAIEEAVEGLRASGQYDYVARGLLARAAFRRAVGDGPARRATSAWRGLAEPGPMRLYLCDIALEQARLALAGREAFAPLNGLVEPSPPPPV